MSILLTGAAGFVGYHVGEALLARGEQVIGVDCVNHYYDVRLKEARLARLAARPGFSFARIDITDRHAMQDLLAANTGIDRIVHLAAQAGVRYSLVDPYAYVASNVMGHLVLLECARHLPGLKHLVYASSSSVYGANTTLPFVETQRVDTPMSLYAATKRADELMSYAYGHLFAIPQTGLRFFTVYGAWGRPDKAYYGFAEAIMSGRPITLYEGRLSRDFTYIDDVVQGVLGCLDRPSGEIGRVLNIGNHRSESVTTLIGLLEQELGRSAIIQHAPRPLADVEETFADIAAIAALTGYAPRTPLAVGIPLFARWFKQWSGAPQS
jgi:UDP-glucuronate 4-epimerase